MRNYYLFILLLITLIGAFFRLYKLSDFPVHLGHDEISQLYDAISLSETGKDINGENLPFIFKSTDDYKPPFYTYATIVSYKIFGWREVTVRIVGAFFGIILIPTIFYFVLKLFNNLWIATFSAFFTAISPIGIIFSRKSFENDAGIFFLLAGFTIALVHQKSQRKGLLILSVLLISLASYTYFAHAILIPFLLLIFLIIYGFGTRRNNLIAVILFVILLLPLLFLIVKNPESQNRTKSVYIGQDPQIKSKIEEIGYSNKTVYQLGKTYLILNGVYMKYLKHLDPNYLFVNGLNMTNYNFIEIGILFKFQLPLIILGIYYLIRKKMKYEGLFILLIILVAMIPNGLTFEDFSPHRSLLVYLMLNILSAMGFYSLYILVKRKIVIKKLLGLLFAFVLVYEFSFYARIYLVNNPIERSEYLHYPFKNVALKAWENYEKYEKIIIDPKFGEREPFIGTGMQYYLAFYGNYPPSKLQDEYKIGDQTKREIIFDKFRIRSVYWPEDKDLKNTLIIASYWSLPENIKEQANISDTIYYYDGKPAFYVISL